MGEGIGTETGFAAGLGGVSGVITNFGVRRGEMGSGDGRTGSGGCVVGLVVVGVIKGEGGSGRVEACSSAAESGTGEVGSSTPDTGVGPADCCCGGGGDDAAVGALVAGAAVSWIAWPPLWNWWLLLPTVAPPIPPALLIPLLALPALLALLLRLLWPARTKRSTSDGRAFNRGRNPTCMHSV